MREIKIDESLNIPIEKVWNLFVDLDNYPKYFKYVHKIFHKGEMKLGSTWYDLASFIVPVIVKHKTTIFEKEKEIGFDVYIPISGYIKERIQFKTSDKNTTNISGSITFNLGNPIFSFLFDGIFEKKMRESIEGAILKAREDFSTRE